jgi:polysaccharide deacetylase family protein (PEP-CTERM system associated)
MKEKNNEPLKYNEAETNINILSIDLEDYFMVTAFENVVKRENWERYESRIERNTYRLLEILDNFQIPSPSATFFCLGWVAERFPHLIKEIHSQGHEIASHGYNHRMIFPMLRDEFREDVRRTKAILEGLVGEKIFGYRAPSYSITRQTLWALEILAEEGYVYDSSIFPIHHDRYGIPDAPRYPFYIEFGDADILSQLKLPKYLNKISRSDYAVSEKKSNSDMETSVTFFSMTNSFFIEFPISTLRIYGYNLPIGGGYFRLFPLQFTLWAMRQTQRKDGVPFVFYIHPWEIDLEMPMVYGVSPISRFRHYVNIKKTEDRLKKLLRTIPFSSFYKILEVSNL